MTKAGIRLFFILFASAMALMIGCYQMGYDNAIPWEVTTTAEIEEVKGLTIQNGFLPHHISGEVYKLKEQYRGGTYLDHIIENQYFALGVWIAIALLLVASSFLRRYGFFAFMALFAFFLHNLNLHEVGLFSFSGRLVMLLPLILLVGPLFYFHEYRPSTSIFLRLTVILIALGICFWGIEDLQRFSAHQLANTSFSLALACLLFLFAISEEIIFLILKLITTGKGGKSNHLHFIFLSLIYLGNIILYFLNKSGYFPNSFFFFDPFFLLAISSLIAIWTMLKKEDQVSSLFPNQSLPLLALSLGILSFLFLAQSMYNGNDAIYEAMHYFIIYFHIGFGFFFFCYIIVNFIDPLIKGYEIHKIAYKERNFPYATARLGGMVVIVGLYLLSNQEPLNLLQAGNYTRLSQKSYQNGDYLLAKEYLLEAGQRGFNIHKANYELGKIELAQGNEYRAKVFFEKASGRFPSPHSIVNFGDLALTLDRAKTRALYEEQLRSRHSSEIANNLGLQFLEDGELTKALNYFQKSENKKDWNQAPLVNKWYASVLLSDTVPFEESVIESDWLMGHYGVKANMLLTAINQHKSINFAAFEDAKSLHRQAFLLNAAMLTTADSVAYYMEKELSTSANAENNNRYRKALAILYYKMGYVNKSLQFLDELQSRDFAINRGKHMADMGKIAMLEGANQLATNYFEKAIEKGEKEGYFGKLEVLFLEGKEDKVPDLLLELISKSPEYTITANRILDDLKKRKPGQLIAAEVTANDDLEEGLSKLSSSELLEIANRNAFDERRLLRIVDELEAREASGSYELLVGAIELNPYSVALLKAYILKALEWNLLDYAEQTLDRLQDLLTDEEYEAFEKNYLKKIAAISSEGWD